MKTLKFLALTLLLFVVSLFATVGFILAGLIGMILRPFVLDFVNPAFLLCAKANEKMNGLFEWAESVMRPGSVKSQIKRRKLIEPEPRQQYCISFYGPEMRHLKSIMMDAENESHAKAGGIAWARHIGVDYHSVHVERV